MYRVKERFALVVKNKYCNLYKRHMENVPCLNGIQIVKEM